MNKKPSNKPQNKPFRKSTKPKVEKVEEKPTFPMRINKYLALKGLSTRRGADALIEKGLVTVNGKKPSLGDLVNENDKVELKDSTLKKEYRYVAYYKPKGIITHSPQGDEQDIASATKGEKSLKGLFPIGRLDKASHGLIILTDDGRITDRLLSPNRVHEKEYVVESARPLRPSFADNMSKGVKTEDYTTKPCKVTVIGETKFRITLTEGKKHQIRRMVVAMHNEVTDIKRVRVMNIKLGNMRAGEFRKIEGKELKEFLESLGLLTQKI